MISPRDRASAERLLQRYHERNKFAVLEIIALLPAQALPRVCKRNTSRHSLEDRLASWISSIAQSVSEMGLKTTIPRRHRAIPIIQTSGYLCMRSSRWNLTFLWRKKKLITRQYLYLSTIIERNRNMFVIYLNFARQVNYFSKRSFVCKFILLQKDLKKNKRNVRSINLVRRSTGTTTSKLSKSRKETRMYILKLSNVLRMNDSHDYLFSTFSSCHASLIS